MDVNNLEVYRQGQVKKYIDPKTLKRKSCSKIALCSNVNKWINIWNIIVVTLAMLNSILVPLEVATDAEPFKTDFWFWFNTVIDLVFTLDVLIVFNTKIIVEGEEIDDRRRICLAYLKGHFTVDLLAALPVDAILLVVEDGRNLGGLLFKPLSFLKLSRLLRLVKVVSRLPHPRD